MLSAFMLSQLYPNGEFSLGLSMPVKSPKPPQPSFSRERSGKPQTTYSKRMVRNCVAKLERDHGRDNLAFDTFTLPELPEEDMAHLRATWGDVAKALMKAIGRDLERAGINPEWVYINEIQLDRYKKSGVIAPHIHVVFQARKSRYHPYAISKERNTEIWNRVLSNALGREVEAPAGARIEKIRKSAERYMAKYMSKGGSLAQELIDGGYREMLPKQWWGASLSLRDWVRANIRLFTVEAQQFIKANYKHFEENLKQSPFSWLYCHCITLMEPHGEEREFPVAIIGKLKREWMDSFDWRELVDAPMAWDW